MSFLPDPFNDFKSSDAIQQEAAGNANATQNRALDAQERIYQQQRADFQPYQKMGTDGVATQAAFLTDPEAYIQKSPTYQWKKNEVDKNMNRQLSARGRSNSTAGMQALGNAYGNLAASEYNDYYNKIIDAIKIGQGAASTAGAAGTQLGSAYQNNANNVGNIAQGLANYQSQSMYNNQAVGTNIANAFKQYNSGANQYSGGYGGGYTGGLNYAANNSSYDGSYDVPSSYAGGGE